MRTEESRSAHIAEESVVKEKGMVEEEKDGIDQVKAQEG